MIESCLTLMLILAWFCVSQRVDSCLSVPDHRAWMLWKSRAIYPEHSWHPNPCCLVGNWMTILPSTSLNPSCIMGALLQQACRKGQGQWLAALELILSTQPFVAHPPLNFLSRKYSAHPSSQETLPTASPEGQGFTDISKWFIGWWTHLESTSFLSPRCPWKHRSDTGLLPLTVLPSLTMGVRWACGGSKS